MPPTTSPTRHRDLQRSPDHHFQPAITTLGEAKRAALALEQALRLSRRTLADLESDDERRRRIDALAHIRGIHEAPGGADCSVMLGEPVRYSFKLVFPDGRWAIDEKQLV